MNSREPVTSESRTSESAPPQNITPGNLADESDSLSRPSTPIHCFTAEDARSLLSARLQSSLELQRIYDTLFDRSPVASYAMLILLQSEYGAALRLPPLTLAKDPLVALDTMCVFTSKARESMPHTFRSPNKDASFNGSEYEAAVRREAALNNIVSCCAALASLSDIRLGEERRPTITQLVATIYLHTAKDGPQTLAFTDCIAYLHSAYANAGDGNLPPRDTLPWRGSTISPYKTCCQNDGDSQIFGHLVGHFVRNPGEMISSRQLIEQYWTASGSTRNASSDLAATMVVLEALGLAQHQFKHRELDPNQDGTLQNQRSRPLDVYANPLGPMLKPLPERLVNPALQILGLLLYSNGPMTQIEIVNAMERGAFPSHPGLRLHRETVGSTLRFLEDQGFIQVDKPSSKGVKDRRFSLNPADSELVAAWENTKPGEALPAHEYRALRTRLLPRAE